MIRIECGRCGGQAPVNPSRVLRRLRLPKGWQRIVRAGQATALCGGCDAEMDLFLSGPAPVRMLEAAR